MSTQTYATQDGRINEVKGELIAHAEPHEVLALGCKMMKMPKKAGDNITYRRVLPRGATSTNANSINRWSVTAASHVVSEGVTPNPDNIVYHDVAVTQQQYGCLYSYTDKAAELYEDDIPADQKKEAGERMGLVREMIRYGSMKSCTNVFYAGGTSRATVDERVSLNLLRRITRGLQLNGTRQITEIIEPGVKYDTSAVSAGYIVFCSTDIEPDIRDLPGFVPIEKYAGKDVINENEIGSVERYRFITSKELTAYADAGAAVGTTGLASTSASNIDVYPLIIMGEEAVFDVAIQGLNTMKVNHIPHTQVDKSDPGGQRGYLSLMFWSAVLVANPGWMAVAEVGTTDLS